MHETEGLHACTMRLAAFGNGHDGPGNQGCVTGNEGNNIKRITYWMRLPQREAKMTIVRAALVQALNPAGLAVW
jgi:hypothetical protein